MWYLHTQLVTCLCRRENWVWSLVAWNIKPLWWWPCNWNTSFGVSGETGQSRAVGLLDEVLGNGVWENTPTQGYPLAFIWCYKYRNVHTHAYAQKSVVCRAERGLGGKAAHCRSWQPHLHLSHNSGGKESPWQRWPYSHTVAWIPHHQVHHMHIRIQIHIHIGEHI